MAKKTNRTNAADMANAGTVAALPVAVLPAVEAGWSPQTQRNLREERSKWWNPLSWLTPDAYNSQVDMGRAGDWPTVQWTWRYIEQEFETLRACIARRRAALGKLTWEVKRRDDSTEAKLHQAELNDFIDGIRGFDAGWLFLATAEFRMFAHVGISKSAHPGYRLDLFKVEQHHWRQCDKTGRWMLSGGTHRGADEEVSPLTYIVRTVDNPVNIAAGRRFIKANFGESAFASATEDGGVTGLFMEMPANVPKGQESQYVIDAEKALGSMRAAIPNGAKPHFIGNTQGGAVDLYTHFLDFQDAKVVLSATGGKLTMLTEATGMGSGANESHDQAFADLAEAEGKEIAAVIQEQLLEPHCLALAFPGRKPLAWFEIKTMNEKDRKLEADTLKTVKEAGFKVSAETAGEMLEMTLEDAGTVVTEPPKGGTPSALPNREQGRPAPVVLPNLNDLPEAARKIAESLGKGNAALLQAVGVAMKSDTPAAWSALLEVWDTLAGTGDAAIEAFEQFYATSLVSGWAAK
jgi:phage gp29-like protein